MGKEEAERKAKIAGDSGQGGRRRKANEGRKIYKESIVIQLPTTYAI